MPLPGQSEKTVSEDVRLQIIQAFMVLLTPEQMRAFYREEIYD